MLQKDLLLKELKAWIENEIIEPEGGTIGHWVIINTRNIKSLGNVISKFPTSSNISF